MKILWLSHLVPYPPKGGVLQRSYNMIREASKYHNITLISFNQAKFLKASLPESDDAVSLARDELLKNVESIEIFDIPENTIPAGRYWVALRALLTGKSYNMEWLRSSKYRNFLENLLAEETFDIVHMDTISLCVYYNVLQSLPVVLNHHNFESQMLKERSESEPNIFKRYYYRLESKRLLKSEIEYCRGSNLNITCSEDDAEAMRITTSRDNFLSVPNAVDTSYFYPKPSVKPAKNSILLVGGLSWYPNREAVEYFINEIWPLLKNEVPDIQVDIVGRNPTPEMLKLADTEVDFHVHGFVDDVRTYLWESKFYLCPIRIGGGTKLKILDALATGCCIISHPFACKGINVREGEHALYAEKPEDFVNQIKYLIDNPEVQKKLREEGPKLIKDYYSYDRIGQEYSSSIIKLVHSSKTQ